MKQCRAVAPDGLPCRKPRGHRRFEHATTEHRKFTGGVRAQSRWVVEEGEPHFSEGDYQSWMRL